MTVRVLIVDDSPLVRGILRLVLSRTPDLDVVGEAGDGKLAVQLVKELRPDVVTMDVLMPMMGGMDAIVAIMRERPTPIVVVADARGDPDGLAMEGLACGAVDVFPKPAGGFTDAAAADLADLLRAAARVRVRSVLGRERAPSPSPARTAFSNRASCAVVGIVASTGGPKLLRALLAAAPASSPPILIVQHTARGFLEGLRTWLAAGTSLRVEIARDGQRVGPGEVLLAPEDAHLEIAAGAIARIGHAPPVGGHRPSGTLLLRSIAAMFGPRALGVVLTGMGSDGADGLAAIEAAGGTAIVEDPAGATVSGMPQAALARLGRPIVEDADGIAALIARLTARPGA